MSPPRYRVSKVGQDGTIDGVESDSEEERKKREEKKKKINKNKKKVPLSHKF